MPEAVKPAAARLDEERLAHALVSRGLLLREEVQSCLGRGEPGPEPLLARLTAAGLLTANQARRARKDLETLLGQQIPGYELVEKLGHGAMGTVYKARQLSMNRLVAVKILKPSLLRNRDYLERLRREAQLAAKLSHNNIVQAIDVGSAGVVHYFVMELIEGRTIKEELEAGKVYKEKEAVEIILQIAQALEHAGRRGLVHRDIKPANIVLTADGIAKLADLGLARDTADAGLARAEKGLAIGTPYYMSPEQIRGEAGVDIRADIYSLGATFYHMVTGVQPFRDPEVQNVLAAHLETPLTPPDHLNHELSGGLGEVVEFMMAKDREDRYRAPEDLIIDLECLLHGDAPKVARQHIKVSSLQGLAEGEAVEEGRPARRPGPTWVWVCVLGGALAVSVLLNLVLLLRGR